MTDRTTTTNGETMNARAELLTDLALLLEQYLDEYGNGRSALDIKVADILDEADAVDEDDE
jgi:hypothetical protein